LITEYFWLFLYMKGLERFSIYSIKGLFYPTQHHILIEYKPLYDYPMTKVTLWH
jgi:hypothetical protein